MKNKIITYDQKSISINGKRVILFGGEMHYFRIPHELWEDRLSKMKNAGCNIISLYIPWNWHEPEKGKERWEGDQDLDHLLKLCEKYQLYVVIKPGPYINAEWDCGGFPHWVLYNIELDKLRVWNPEYLEIVKVWYTKIIRVLKPHLITNGGSIILLQIENEYDHLIELSKLIIPPEEAYKYLMYHLNLVRELGIDIPVFTNEGKLIRGTEIIETRTFYPDIPWLWKWCFKWFDLKIQDMLQTQPDKPVLIMELEAGWFGQFGLPLYEVAAELPDAIIKNCYIQGASLFNLFMFAGGTTFPFWGCRGDIYGVTPPGTGATTSYDFGNPPIREWGEISLEKYYNSRAMALFLDSFPELLYDTRVFPEYTEFVKGGEEEKILFPDSVTDDVSFAMSDNKIMALQRSNNEKGLLFLRNLDEDPKEVAVKYISPLHNIKQRFPVIGSFTIPAYSAFLFPLDISIPGSGITIKYSTSELQTSKKLGDNTLFILQGREGTAGELLLDTKGADVECLLGKANKEVINHMIRISYQHHDLLILKTGRVIILIINKNLAGRIWTADNILLLADLYYVRNFSVDQGNIRMEAEIKKGEKNNIFFFSLGLPGKVFIADREIQFNYLKIGTLYLVSLDYQEDNKNSVEIKWSPSWKYYADNQKQSETFDDSQWQSMEEPVALEKLGIYEHGYYWYRTDFSLPDGLSDIKMVIDTNGADRAGFYLNGKFIWKGIGCREENITAFAHSGKNVLAICYENSFHTKGHPGEGPIIKYSGLQNPVIIKANARGTEYVQEIKKFRFKEVLGNGYFLPGFNDKGWNILQAGEKYTGSLVMGDYIWFRRKFRYLPDKNGITPLKLTIKKASERCLIYLNGRALGKYEAIGPQHDFYIPESFLKEENLLAILLEGPGNDRPVLFEPVIEPYFQAQRREIKISL